MSKNLIQLFKLLISMGLAALLLHLVFRHVDWRDFWQKAKTVDYTWVLLSVFLSTVSYLARAYRWNILLKPLGHDLKASRTTLAVLVGYFANLAIPRLGEITRCGVLNRHDRVPVSEALGTVFTERLVDVLTVFLFLGIGLFMESERLTEFLKTAYRDVEMAPWIWIVVFVTATVGISLLWLIIKNQHRLKGKFATWLKGFVAGILSLKDMKNPAGFVLSTFVLWAIYYSMSYIIVFSLPETHHLDMGVGFMLLITGSLAFILPVQSGFGAYHGMVAGMLLLYGVEKNTGIFLATLIHTSHIMAVILFGTVAMIVLFLTRRKGQVVRHGGVQPMKQH